MSNDTELMFSQQVDVVREKMAALRGELDDIARKTPFENQAQDVHGLLTCGLVTLYSLQSDAIKLEIQHADATRGPHMVFRPRGIGLDMCPGCFVCGALDREPGANGYLHNIAAFVASEADGRVIVGWFPGSRARVDFRPSEPGWVQVKVGACTAHLPNLKALEKRTSVHGVIRQADVIEICQLTSTECA